MEQDDTVTFEKNKQTKNTSFLAFTHMSNIDQSLI